MEKILFIFELNGTILDIENKVSHDQLVPPFKVERDILTDSEGIKCILYPEIKKILEKISTANYSIAFTAKSSKPAQTKEILRLFGIDIYADITAFNLLNKADQIESVSSQSGIPHSNILYFDSSRTNTAEVRYLGATTFLIPEEGLTFDTFLLTMKNASLALDLERLKITWGKK